MKKNYLKIIIAAAAAVYTGSFVFADELSLADTLLTKSQETATIEEDSYTYIHMAKSIYEEEYNKKPADIKILLGLSKINRLLDDRAESKLYLSKAYKINPADPVVQKASGDFFYGFQEYSTAIEYYKLALASGLLKDYETNLQSAKCFEKLGDSENAELYYKICLYLNPDSKEAADKLKEYDAEKHPDLIKKEREKNRKAARARQRDIEADNIIDVINSLKN